MIVVCVWYSNLCLIASDFNSTSIIPIYFGVNATEIAVNITIVDDTQLEHTEEFVVDLVIPDNARDIGVNFGSITSAVVMIVDDDSKWIQCYSNLILLQLLLC